MFTVSIVKNIGKNTKITRNPITQKKDMTIKIFWHFSLNYALTSLIFLESMIFSGYIVS